MLSNEKGRIACVFVKFNRRKCIAYRLLLNRRLCKAIVTIDSILSELSTAHASAFTNIPSLTTNALENV